MKILDVVNLSKYYGKKETLIKALDDVSFSVEKGEFIAIVGASGSGKSTLLHILAGVDKETSGTFYVGENEPKKFNEKKLAIYRRREVGLIYQFYNLIPILTVKENIVLPLSLDNKKIDDNYLNELINVLGLNDRVNHLPNELSGGQQQRVSIGRALINRPSIILADEPTGNLDSKTGAEIIDLLKLSNKKFNQTLILVTHDMELARNADRILTMKDGKIISDQKVNSNESNE